MARRGESGLSGIILVDKPAGMTSHDVVNRVRRIFGEKRVGHAGTLDPAATGLLVVCVGPATRLAQYLTAAHKTYEARIVFGTQTATDDAEGPVIATAPVPDELGDPFFAAGFVASLVGEHQQVPPAYSAIKRDGKAAYDLARKGEEVVLDARTIQVREAVLLGIELDPQVTWDVRFDVSKGTYIRSLARDIGTTLGSAAHLGGLRRISSGRCGVADSVTLEELASCADPTAYFVDPAAALDLPVVEISEDVETPLIQGKTLQVEGTPASGPVAVVCGSRLLSIHDVVAEGLRPATVIPGGVTGVRG